MWIEEIDQQLRAELRQINELGMQQAAEMLSRLLRQPITVAVPGGLSAEQLQVELEQSPAGLGVFMGITGDLSGGLLLYFSCPSAHWLSSQLLGQSGGDDLLAEPAASTLKEVGNIIASAFLASLDNQLQVRALPTPPQLFLTPLAELLSQQQATQLSPGPIVCSHLSGAEQAAECLQGAIYLFPETASLELLLERVAAGNS